MPYYQLIEKKVNYRGTPALKSITRATNVKRNMMPTRDAVQKISTSEKFLQK